MECDIVKIPNVCPIQFNVFPVIFFGHSSPMRVKAWQPTYSLTSTIIQPVEGGECGQHVESSSRCYLSRFELPLLKFLAISWQRFHTMAKRSFFTEVLISAALPSTSLKHSALNRVVTMCSELNVKSWYYYYYLLLLSNY